MIEFTTGNLLDSEAEALVNTVNTVGVMGKGVALMFKEAFPANFEAYEAACAAKEVQLGHMFVTERKELFGPKWIINFPTKGHWRYPSKMEWIVSGLRDLRKVVETHGIGSIALPPLGAGNGGLQWPEVREHIEAELTGLADVRVIIYEPTAKYQNVAKRAGVEKLTATRALIAELVYRYSILGIECTLLEVQKLAYFLERYVIALGLNNAMDFQFGANRYGPYSDRLKHLLNGLDGSYLHCDKRLGDAGPFDVIRFDYSKRDKVAAFLTTADAKTYSEALAETTKLIDGFESPLSMELIATVDWLIHHDGVEPTVDAVKSQLKSWTGGEAAGKRKLALFEDRMIEIAIDALVDAKLVEA
ncbi:MAG: Appr-1-p processing protein [Bradyrhizobiaceae bacterium PARB1]|nr:MAG: Appr-1-p processing protein [Bradyrhizobiaceae bacterium PARB1]